LIESFKTNVETGSNNIYGNLLQDTLGSAAKNVDFMEGTKKYMKAGFDRLSLAPGIITPTFPQKPEVAPVNVNKDES
jgi:hypothetical protein